MKKTIFTLLLTIFFASGTISVAKATGDCDIVFDFENEVPLPGHNLTAVVISNNPYQAGINPSSKALRITSTTGYDFKGVYFSVTIPNDKTFEDIYTTIEFQLATVGNSLNGKNTFVGVSDNGTTWSTAYDGSASNFGQTWTTRTVAVSSLNTNLKNKTGTFFVGIGIKNEETGNDYYLDNIILVANLANCDMGNKYTATLNPGAGTCEVPSVTENAAGSGVTLPSASPSTKCAEADYTFAGWSESAITGTSIAPTLIPAGLYLIEDNITLYAVYTNGTVYNSNPICDQATSLKELNAETVLYYTNNILYASQPANILIYDLTGQILKSDKNISETDLSKLSSGMYVVKVLIDGKQFVKKIVKK